MKSLSCKSIFSLSTLATMLLSTTYAHAGNRYLCVFEQPSQNTRFELDIREESGNATLSYKFAPYNAPSTVVQGKVQLNQTGATWSHFIFTGKDANAQIKASVPVSLADNSVYLDIDFSVNGQQYDSINSLQCSPR